jgi:lipopolysaccharide/colanic/teichoic acid biosynthesis glycosyltransferase
LARAASIPDSSDHLRSTSAPSQAIDQERFVASAWNRAFDVVVAATLLVMLSPMFAMLSLLIACDGGPVFLLQKRVGRCGRVFGCLKFRSTMPSAPEVLECDLAEHAAARDEWRRLYKLQSDPRTTSIGAILRSTSLDELPQLLNVLRGDMSLIGPRPLVPDELHHHDGTNNAYHLMIWPGITGVWQ